MNVLLVDHQDSFTYNLVHEIGVIVGRFPTVLDSRCPWEELLGRGPSPGMGLMIITKGSRDRVTRPLSRDRVFCGEAGWRRPQPSAGVVVGASGPADSASSSAPPRMKRSRNPVLPPSTSE